MKGIFSSMDAVVAILVTLIVISTVFALLETKAQEDNSLELSRLARDVYEIKYNSPGAIIPGWVKQDPDCSAATEIAVDQAFEYNPATNELTEVFTMVCV